MPSLSEVVNKMKEVDSLIADLRRGMRHVHPYSVDALKRHVNELEKIRERIMREPMDSQQNLEDLLNKLGNCIRECLYPPYTGKPQTLPKPVPTPWEPPVTVPGVNLIMVVDSSESMWDALSVGGRIYELLVDWANYIKDMAEEAKVPATASVVWYGDPTNPDNRPHDVITMNKEPISNFPSKISQPVTDWSIGVDFPESGMTAIHNSIEEVYDPSVENSLILVSDDSNKISGGPYDRPELFSEVSLGAVTSKLDSLGIFNRYGLIPPKENAHIEDFFLQVRNYNKSGISFNYISDWARWTLDPTQAPGIGSD